MLILDIEPHTALVHVLSWGGHTSKIPRWYGPWSYFSDQKGGWGFLIQSHTPLGKVLMHGFSWGGYIWKIQVSAYRPWPGGDQHFSLCWIFIETMTPHSFLWCLLSLWNPLRVFGAKTPWVVGGDWLSTHPLEFERTSYPKQRTTVDKLSVPWN